MASIAFAQSEHAPEDYSDELIEHLLQQAEARLRGEQPTLSLVPTHTSITASTSRSKTASLPAPAVQKRGSVARVDSKSIVNSEEQKLASQGIRKVEDPTTVKRQDLKVGRIQISSE